MLWKKTATNYSKWDYYTSSSEEEDLTGQEPIVPSDGKYSFLLKIIIIK